MTQRSHRASASAKEAPVSGFAHAHVTWRNRGAVRPQTEQHWRKSRKKSSDSVSNVEIETPMALIYKALSPSLSTFETLPPTPSFSAKFSGGTAPQGFCEVSIQGGHATSTRNDVVSVGGGNQTIVLLVYSHRLSNVCRGWLYSCTGE